MSFAPQSSKPDFNLIRQSVHSYRSDNHIFEKSISMREGAEQYRFYDGPPFITGLPHYGHLASSVAKDVIPRYQTMKGKQVDRVRGWDCHGIPIEQKVQKKLGLESNLDIEKVGIETFIQGCYDYTRSTSEEWKRYIEQFGRRVDFDHSYKTMDNDYMESVRRVFKTLRDKGLIYKGKRVSLYSTKLETPISNFEVAMDDTYEEVNDPAITVMFELQIPHNSPFNKGDAAKVFVLAWTTTPWTIPLNIALAVNKDIAYVSVNYNETIYIVAKNRLEVVFVGKEYTIIDEFLGELLLGLSYTPPFDYLYGKTANEKDHHIYHADFVTDTDGTGIAHEAPEFGEADFQLAKKEGLTITEGMDSSGHYTSIMGDKSAMFYRDANPVVMQELHTMGRLFAKASITHRVAFCPRSGTPLVYKAQDSWFIDLNGQHDFLGGKSLKERCIEKNEDINRYPDHNKHGRFLKSLESAPDRCISRTRYRGTPMPIYKSLDGKDMMVLGSREELFELSKNGSKNITKHLYIRHGETDFNVNHTRCSRGDARLTEKGHQQAKQTFEQIQSNVTSDDIIILSPLYRTWETAMPLLKKLYSEKYELLENIYKNYCNSFQSMFDDETIQLYINNPDNKKLIQLLPGFPIYIDFRLCELLLTPDQQGGASFGSDGLPKIQLKRSYETTYGDGSESQRAFYDRVSSLITEVNDTFGGKQVMYFGHGGTGRHFIKFFADYDFDKERKQKKIKNGDIKTYYRNTTRHAELDLHRPYIDDVRFEKDGVRYERISEVLDCRVESASMPYAQVHYPFENKEKFERSFPADYIVEYTGQIRAWFYVMHVLGVALFDKPAFTNVICHGVVAGNDGRKMSKSLGNFPDPKPTFAQYGGDAVRMSILTTPLFNGGDMSFSEDLILEALKQNILPLWNAFSFFTTYANIDGRKSQLCHPELVEGSHPGDVSTPLRSAQHDANAIVSHSSNRLDTWILGELQRVTETIDHDLSHYDITHASRQVADFLENLTNRYIRRSRRRFWKSESDEDKNHAYTTLYTVLVNFSLVISPFMPFISEYIRRALTGDDITNSVHLQDFPSAKNCELGTINCELSADMGYAQQIVRIGLAARSKKNIRVRQPLQSLTLGVLLGQYYLDIIADELNIKQVICDGAINDRVMKICKPDGKIVGSLFADATKEIFALAKSGDFIANPDGSVTVGAYILPPGSYEISYIKKDQSDDIDVEQGITMLIDRTITPDLEREGYARDLVRAIQDARKEADYDIADRIKIELVGSMAEDLINYHGKYIQEETLSTISYGLTQSDIQKSVELGDQTIVVSLLKSI